MSFFTLAELIRSKKAEEQGIENVPDFDAVQGIKALRDKVLDPARVKIGKPILVTNCFRCLKLNEAVGGADGSQHVANAIFAAADCDQGSIVANKELFDAFCKGPFDQLIWEKGGEWVHVSYRTDGRNRYQVIGI